MNEPEGFSPAASGAQLSNAAFASELTYGSALIAAERKRQMTVEGWSPEHDDDHIDQELAKAAACYAMPDQAFTGTLDRVRAEIVPAWPWSEEWDKRNPDVRCWVPSARHVVYTERRNVREWRIRELAKAGALIAAEIDRLRRLP